MSFFDANEWLHAHREDANAHEQVDEFVRTVMGGGNLFPDTFFAALAIENDCTWLTRDRDYTRFDGLKIEMI